MIKGPVLTNGNITNFGLRILADALGSMKNQRVKIIVGMGFLISLEKIVRLVFLFKDMLFG